MQAVVNLTYGCLMLLEPTRLEVSPIIINSGFRSEAVNRKVGGVSNSQNLIGQAADIHPKDPAKFWALVEKFQKLIVSLQRQKRNSQKG